MGTSTDLSSARSGFAVTPSDSTTYSGVRRLYIGTAGHVAVVLVDGGGSLVHKNVPNGGWLDVQAVQVMATGTTATDIVAHR